MIHRWSGRAGGPFVPACCATLSELLVESELFGHEQRREDIPAFTGAFLARFFREKGMEPRDLSAAAREAFVSYSWPGNVRELENVCERIAQTCACDPILVTCVPASVLLDG